MQRVSNELELDTRIFKRTFRDVFGPYAVLTIEPDEEAPILETTFSQTLSKCVLVALGVVAVLGLVLTVGVQFLK